MAEFRGVAPDMHALSSLYEPLLQTVSKEAEENSFKALECFLKILGKNRPEDQVKEHASFCKKLLPWLDRAVVSGAFAQNATVRKLIPLFAQAGVFEGIDPQTKMSCVVLRNGTSQVSINRLALQMQYEYFAQKLQASTQVGVDVVIETKLSEAARTILKDFCEKGELPQQPFDPIPLLEIFSSPEADPRGTELDVRRNLWTAFRFLILTAPKRRDEESDKRLKELLKRDSEEQVAASLNLLFLVYEQWDHFGFKPLSETLINFRTEKALQLVDDLSNAIQMQLRGLHSQVLQNKEAAAKKRQEIKNRWESFISKTFQAKSSLTLEERASTCLKMLDEFGSSTLKKELGSWLRQRCLDAVCQALDIRTYHMAGSGKQQRGIDLKVLPMMQKASDFRAYVDEQFSVLVISKERCSNLEDFLKDLNNTNYRIRCIYTDGPLKESDIALLQARFPSLQKDQIFTFRALPEVERLNPLHSEDSSEGFSVSSETSLCADLVEVFAHLSKLQSEQTVLETKADSCAKEMKKMNSELDNTEHLALANFKKGLFSQEQRRGRSIEKTAIEAYKTLAMLSHFDSATVRFHQNSLFEDVFKEAQDGVEAITEGRLIALNELPRLLLELRQKMQEQRKTEQNDKQNIAKFVAHLFRTRGELTPEQLAWICLDELDEPKNTAEHLFKQLCVDRLLKECGIRQYSDKSPGHELAYPLGIGFEVAPFMLRGAFLEKRSPVERFLRSFVDALVITKETKVGDILNQCSGTNEQIERLYTLAPLDSNTQTRLRASFPKASVIVWDTPIGIEEYAEEDSISHVPEVSRSRESLKKEIEQWFDEYNRMDRRAAVLESRIKENQQRYEALGARQEQALQNYVKAQFKNKDESAAREAAVVIFELLPMLTHFNKELIDSQRVRCLQKLFKACRIDIFNPPEVLSTANFKGIVSCEVLRLMSRNTQLGAYLRRQFNTIAISGERGEQFLELMRLTAMLKKDLDQKSESDSLLNIEYLLSTVPLEPGDREAFQKFLPALKQDGIITCKKLKQRSETDE